MHAPSARRRPLTPTVATLQAIIRDESAFPWPRTRAPSSQGAWCAACDGQGEPPFQRWVKMADIDNNLSDDVIYYPERGPGLKMALTKQLNIAVGHLGGGWLLVLFLVLLGV